jgi:hypothetical protein
VRKSNGKLYAQKCRNKKKSIFMTKNVGHFPDGKALVPHGCSQCHPGESVTRSEGKKVKSKKKKIKTK